MNNLVQDEGTCPICLEIFKNPHMLSCGHNTCYLCISTFCEKLNVSDFNCPVCRSSTPFDQVKPNIALRNMLEALCLASEKGNRKTNKMKK